MTEYRDILNSTANSFTQAGMLYPEVAARLMERLMLIKIEPQRIVELGCGLGNLSSRIQTYFPQTDLFTLDIAQRRLQSVMSGYRVCGDATRLPFANNSMDIVMTNLMPHWIQNQTQWLQEASRVLRVNGLLMLSFFATDTLKEIGKPKRPFYDMHDMGDLLIRMGFNDPILDAEKFTLEYDTWHDAIADLMATGEIALLNAPSTTHSGEMNVTYEIVYAHAWKGEQPMTSKIDQEGMVTISLDQIKRRT